MKVKIIKSTRENNDWYEHYIGYNFDVDNCSIDHYIIDSGIYKGYKILKDDCAIWEGFKEENKTTEKESIRLFPSGAKRDNNSNKSFVHNLKGYTRLRFGYHMTKGSVKYGDGNWTKGMPSDQYAESIDRHWAKYINGDRSEDHLSAIIFGIQGIMLNEKEEGIKEDYYFKKTNER